MTLPPDPRTGRRRWVEALVAILVFCVAPLTPSLSAASVALPLGCQLNEGGDAPCLIPGVDIDYPLTVLAFMGFFIVFTLPIGLILLLVWCIAASVPYYRRSRSRP